VGIPFGGIGSACDWGAAGVSEGEDFLQPQILIATANNITLKIFIPEILFLVMFLPLIISPGTYCNFFQY
jgi:hypothetical protein